MKGGHGDGRMRDHSRRLSQIWEEHDDMFVLTLAAVIIITSYSLRVNQEIRQALATAVDYAGGELTNFRKGLEGSKSPGPRDPGGRGTSRCVNQFCREHGTWTSGGYLPRLLQLQWGVEVIWTIRQSEKSLEPALDESQSSGLALGAGAIWKARLHRGSRKTA